MFVLAAGELITAASRYLSLCTFIVVIVAVVDDLDGHGEYWNYTKGNLRILRITQDGFNVISVLAYMSLTHQQVYPRPVCGTY